VRFGGELREEPGLALPREGKEETLPGKAGEGSLHSTYLPCSTSLTRCSVVLLTDTETKLT